MEMSSVRGIYGVSIWDGESNKDVYESFGMGVTSRVVDCGVV